MVARCFAVAGFVVLCLASVCCAAVAAEPWFTDNFDLYTGQNLQGQGGWMNGGDDVRVQNTFAKSERAVKMDVLSWGASESSHYVTTDGTTCYLNVDVAMDTLSNYDGENLGYIKLYNSDGNEITRIYLSHQKLKVITGPGSGAAEVVQENVLMRTWYTVRIGVYPYNNTMDVWVNGMKKLTGKPTFGTPSAVAKVGIAQWSNANILARFTKTETYVDNLTIEPPAVSAKKILSPNLYTNWEAFHVIYPFAMYDSAAGDYKMWYTGSAFAQFNNSNWDQWHTGIAMSTDGATWVRRKYEYEPVLSPHKFYEGDVVDPATCSNIFDSIMAFGGCVIRDGSTYKMWYTGWNGNSEHIGNGITRRTNYRIGYATSPDGINWTKYSGKDGGGSILGLGTSGANGVKGVGQPYVLKDGSNYRMWYEGMDSNGVWRILYATSSDGIDWTYQNTALNPGGSGPVDADGVRNPIVVTRNGQYELWYTGESVASPKSHAMRTISLDGGLTWPNAPSEVELHPDNPLDGNEKMHVDSVIVDTDNACRVFFSKENIVPAARIHNTDGTSSEKDTCIYTEVVNP